MKEIHNLVCFDNVHILKLPPPEKFKVEKMNPP